MNESAEVVAMPKSDRQMLEEIHYATMQTRDDIAAIRRTIEEQIPPVIEKLKSGPLAMFL